ncbi:MAG: TetR/AcrR family transcriptional regulator [Nocardioides sp.]
MVRNEQRRSVLADAGLTVLAREGARGLTHRAVDLGAGVPAGTTSNYFRSRTALIEGLVARIGERLAPEPEVQATLGARPATRALFRDYLNDIVRRLTENSEVALALFELRLEAARRPEAQELMAAWLREGFRADIAFNEAAGLPGGATEIALFHYALDGLLFDRLTIPLEPEVPTATIVEMLVDRLLPESAHPA